MRTISTPEKLNTVEWLRGIAALGICEMHIFCALDFFSKNDTFFQTYIFPISIIGRLGVAIFFVISGFIIPYSMWKRNYSVSHFFSFMRKRLIRLEPPYLLTIVLSILIAFITSSIIANKLYEINWFNLALHIGYLNVFFDNIWVNPVFWTLAIEFQFYIIIGLIFPILNSKSKTYFLLAISLFSAFICLKNPMPQFIFIHFHLFILGILCFLRYTRSISSPAFLFQVVLNSGFLYYFHGKGYVVAALLTVLLILYNVSIKSQSMLFMGKISYSLYLIHWVIGVELIRNLFVHYFRDSSEFTKIVLAVGIIILCLVLSGLFYRIIEQPSIQWAKKPIKFFSKPTEISQQVT